MLFDLLQYATSPNCQMEFRFAHVALRKPIILAVVGTGFKWESTEVIYIMGILHYYTAGVLRKKKLTLTAAQWHC